MIEFSCADFSFPLLNRRQALGLLHILEFQRIDIGLFARNPSYPPSALMESPKEFTQGVIEDLKSNELLPADVFLQIGNSSAELSANDPDLATRARNREVFKRVVEFSVALGCGHMTGLPGVAHGDYGRDFALAASEAAWRIEQCSAAGVVYSIEAHIGSICPDTASAQKLLALVNGLTLTLDYGHFICAGEQNAAIHALLPFASHLHARGGARGRLQASVQENTIDFEGMMKGLCEVKYEGAIALEYVWVDWEGCNRTDNISETILLRQRLRDMAEAHRQRSETANPR